MFSCNIPTDAASRFSPTPNIRGLNSSGVYLVRILPSVFGQEPGSLRVDLEQELNSLHSISVGTKQLRVPLKFLLVKQFFRLALKGDNKALLRSLEILDTIQKANAKRYVELLQPRFTSADLKNMTDDQRTTLYFETLKQLNQPDEDED